MTASRRRRGILAAICFAGAILFLPNAEASDLPDESPPLPQDGRVGITLGGPVSISAERLSFDSEAGVAQAEGNVEIGFGSRRVRADRIRYDANSGDAEFSGRVRYEDEGNEFSFDRIVLNVRSELGALDNGSIRIRYNDYKISSERFEKTGPRTFFVRKGTLTTCPCDGEPDWKFKVAQATVDLDGYAVGNDIVFQVKGVPAAWLPWGAFPVKIRRQSGFLIPSFERSNSKGYSIELPLYWAISRWSDATLTLEAMTRRGFRPEGEYRYVLNPASEGAARFTLFRDRAREDTRYRIYGENRFRLGEDFTANARWDLRSDDRYYEDLVEEDILRTGRHTASRGFASLQGSHAVHALGMVWIQDNQGTSDDTTVQRLPEYVATLPLRPLGGSGIEVSGDLSATWFYRDDGDREARGRGLGGLSRTFELYPSVTFTPFLGVDLYGAVPTRDKTGIEEAGRAVPIGGASLEMTFHRDVSSVGGAGYLHQVSPVAEFRWIPEVDQSEIPLVDYQSRIQPQSQFLFGLDQRLIRSDENGPVEIAFFDLALAVDARKPTFSDSPYVDPHVPYVRALRDQIDLAAGRSLRRPDTVSDVYARFAVVPAERWRLAGEAMFDPTGRNFTVASAGAGYRKDSENRIFVEYRRSRGLAEDLLGNVGYRPFRFLGVKTDLEYSLRNSELTEASVTATLHPRSECWSVGGGVHKRARPDETSLRLIFSLKGIGSIGP